MSSDDAIDASIDNFFNSYVPSVEEGDGEDIFDFSENYDEIPDKISKKLSPEQQNIISAILEGKNVIVDAVAGSGKTTLVLGLAEQTRANILQITYNAALRLEVREKANLYGLSNLVVHSYHSLAVNYYDRKSYTDIVMTDIITMNKKLGNAPYFDIIVIDEAQDMKFLFYQLVKKFVFDNGRMVTLLIMGDYYQAINIFNGADPRFLTFGERIFGGLSLTNEGKFIELPLNTSYRITREIADFVAHTTGKQINTVKGGQRVSYICGNREPPYLKKSEYNKLFWSINNKCEFINRYVFDIIMSKLDSGEVVPEDIFILMPSTRQANHFSRELERHLVARKVPCYISGDDNKISSDVLKGKIVFTTLNQSKGRERKIVFVYHFDSSYFQIYAQDIKSREICPNIHYVAMTRATDELYLCHEKNNSIIQFVTELKYLNFIGQIPEIKRITPDEQRSNISPTILTRFVKDKNALKLDKLLRYSITAATTNIYIPMIEQFSKTYEETCDLIGIATPAAWEFKRYGTCSIGGNLKELSKDILNIIKVANEYQSKTNNYTFKLAQIDNYDWFTDNLVSSCMKNYDDLVCDIDKFEVERKMIVMWRHTSEHRKGDLRKFIMTGYMDGIYKNNIWEFKCVQELHQTHLLQLAVYAFMHEQISNCKNMVYDRTTGDYYNLVEFDKLVPEKSDNVYRLFNCRTGEIWTLEYENILEIMNILFENFVYPYTLEDDNVFVKACNDYVPIKKPSYDELTVVELKKLCKENKIKGYSTKNRSELLEMLEKFDSGNTIDTTDAIDDQIEI